MIGRKDVPENTAFNTELIQAMEQLAREQGVDLITYGCLKGKSLFNRAENTVSLQKWELFFSISLAIHFAESMVDLLKLHEDEGMLFYFNQHNHSLSDQLEYAAHKIAVLLSDNGYRALIVPGRGKGYSKGAPGIISHMALANLSGMGSMSDSGMLVTPEYGPRIRLCSILTNLPLPSGKPAKEHCLHCGLCRQICPSHAIDGRHFEPQNPDESYLDTVACAAYRAERAQKYNGNRFCNLCMMVCPVGKKLKSYF